MCDSLPIIMSNPGIQDGELEFILKLIEIGPQIIVGSLLKKFDGSSKRMKKILKILLKPY